MVSSFLFNSQLSYCEGDEICYPESDGAPMAESDPTRDYLFYGVETLKLHYQNRQDVYVSGNLFIYYEQGIPTSVIAPDVFVIFGVPNIKRPIYKAWEENNQLPSFVLEITSKTTKGIDRKDKPAIYTRLGVREYFQYDPTGDYLEPRLQGSRLVNGVYQPIERQTLPDGSIFIPSEVLGLDLYLVEGDLKFYNRGPDSFYPTYEEMANRLQTVSSELQTVSSRLEESENALKSAIAHLRSSGLNAGQIATILNLSVEKVQSYL